MWYIWYHQYTRLDSILFSVHDNWGHDFRVANPWRPRRPFGACAWHWATPAQPDQKLYRRLHGSVFNRLAIGSLWVCPTTSKHLVIDTYTQKRIRQRQDEKSYLPFTVPYPSIHNCRKHPRTQTLPILSFSWIKLSTRYVMFLPITKMLSLTVLSHFQNCPILGLVSASFMTNCYIPKTHSTCSAGHMCKNP